MLLQDQRPLQERPFLQVIRETTQHSQIHQHLLQQQVVAVETIDKTLKHLQLIQILMVAQVEVEEIISLLLFVLLMVQELVAVVETAQQSQHL